MKRKETIKRRARNKEITANPLHDIFTNDILYAEHLMVSGFTVTHPKARMMNVFFSNPFLHLIPRPSARFTEKWAIVLGHIDGAR